MVRKFATAATLVVAALFVLGVSSAFADDPANVTGGNPMEMDERAKRAYFSKASPQGRREAAKHKTKKASPIPAIYGDPLKTPLKEAVPPGRPVKIELQSTVP